ncbi:MAG: PAS domain S-box protein, partial [Gemmatimonadaceae bacterium]|nr:PAS domain S-box protein [Gemmatimonadaceae bacterium]
MNEKLLARVAAEGATALVVTDAAERVVWVNEAFVRGSGFTLADMLGRRPSEMLQGAGTDPVVRARIAAAIRAGEPITEDILNYRKDGSQVWLTLHIRPLRDSDGVITGFHASQVDITDRRRAELRLERSRERLSDILEGTRAGTWEWNVQTGETRHNERWAEICGYSLAELGPLSIRTWMGLVHPDDLAASNRLLEAHFRGDSAYYDCIARMRHKHGGWVWVHDRGKVTEWTPDGQPLWMAGTHIDVTEMIRASEALRSARDQAQRYLDTVQSVLVALDTAGRVTMLNRAGCELLGVEADDVLGTEWFTRFAPPAPGVSSPRDSIAALLSGVGGDAEFFEAELVAEDGTRRLMRWHNALLTDATGAISGTLSSGEDVTELRTLERQANRRQRLEAIGTLAGGIAHDLNNALTPIVLGAESLRDADEDAAQFIPVIESSARRATQMVRQLLLFARGSGGAHQAVDLGDIAREVHQLATATFPKEITLSLRVADGLPKVLGDPTQLHQVLLNLALNARDAISERGRIAIEVTTAQVDDTPPGHVSPTPESFGAYVVASVADTGSGIPDAAIERIFDPFYTTKRPDAGTGLGLSTVHGLVRGHHGFLAVESQPSRGSTFRVYLPVEGDAASRVSATSRRRQFTHQPMVLYVDDEPGVRGLADLLLRRIGCFPLLAATAAEAAALAASYGERLAAVVTDVALPGHDGLALAAQLRREGRDVPVLLVSGELSDAQRVAMAALPAVTALGKPFSEDELFEAL